MVSFKNTLLLALSASVQASPLAPGSVTARQDMSTDWTPPELPEGVTDISNDTALINEIFPKYGLKSFIEETTSPSSPAAQGGIGIMSGPCDQGACPDHFKAFDLLFTFISVPEGISQSYDIRVDECGQCHRKKVGSTSSGCYDLTGCGRPQTVCVDNKNSRAHRVWKDVNVKKCYRMQHEGLGSCGYIQYRDLWSPVQEVACN